MEHLNLPSQPTLAMAIGPRLGPRETISELAISSGKENRAFYWSYQKDRL